MAFPSSDSCTVHFSSAPVFVLCTRTTRSLLAATRTTTTKGKSLTGAHRNEALINSIWPHGGGDVALAHQKELYLERRGTAIAAIVHLKQPFLANKLTPRLAFHEGHLPKGVIHILKQLNHSPFYHLQMFFF